MKYWSFIDEEKILEELLSNPDAIAKDIDVKVRVLIKHYKREGFSKNEIRNKLDNFLMEHFMGFVLADWDKKLKRWVNKYTKQEHCDFIKMNDIVIYKEELDFISKEWNIEGENNIEIEKLLFVMLVLAKSTGNGQWLNYKDDMAFDLARYKFKRGTPKPTQRGKLLYKLINLEDSMLDYSERSNKTKLLYCVEEGEEIFRITHDACVENIVTMYLDWREYPNYKYCKNCGKEIKTTGNRQKYCDKCAKKIKDLQDKQSYEKRKFRN